MRRNRSNGGNHMTRAFYSALVFSLVSQSSISMHNPTLVTGVRFQLRDQKKTSPPFREPQVLPWWSKIRPEIEKTFAPDDAQRQADAGGAIFHRRKYFCCCCCCCLVLLPLRSLLFAICRSAKHSTGLNWGFACFFRLFLHLFVFPSFNASQRDPPPPLVFFSLIADGIGSRSMFRIVFYCFNV